MGKKHINLYMWVTQDEYELPLFVTEYPKELAKVSGRKISTVYSKVSKYSHGLIDKSPFIKVEVEPWM